MAGRRVVPLVLCALWAVSCGGNNPGPTRVTTTTVATTTPPTTTSVPASQGLRYIGTYTQPSPLPALPLDLSVFFGLPRAFGPAIEPRAIYPNVTGGYNTGPNGFTGTLSGTFDGTPETGGTFTGVLTANLPNGCIARRNYSGPMTPQALNWTPGAQIDACGGASPLSSPMTPPAAPPNQPPSTTIASTSTTISGTTTTVVPSTTTTSSIGATTTTTTSGSTTTTTVLGPTTTTSLIPTTTTVLGPTTTTSVIPTTTTTSTAPLLCGFTGSSSVSLPALSGSGSFTIIGGTPPSGCTPSLDASSCSWATPSLQVGGSVVLNYTYQQQSNNSPQRSCTFTVRNSQNTSDFTQKTISQFGLFSMTNNLTGTVAYSISSPQGAVFNCSHPSSGTNTTVTCSLSAWGTIQLDSTFDVFISGCNQINARSCTVFMDSPKTITFTPNTGF